VCLLRLRQSVGGFGGVHREEELSALDKQYLKFGEAFEHRFLRPGRNTRTEPSKPRSTSAGYAFHLPRDELHRVSDALLAQHYRSGGEKSVIVDQTTKNGVVADPTPAPGIASTQKVVSPWLKLNVAPTKSNFLSLGGNWPSRRKAMTFSNRSARS